MSARREPVAASLLPLLPLVCALAGSAASGCGPAEPSIASSEGEARESFNHHLVMLDGALSDADALDAAAIQRFLDDTPWGNRSPLADYVSHGRTAAQAIEHAATRYQINPLVILTRAQMEQSLIGKPSAEQWKLDWAMGCGCPESGCMEAYRGFDVQVDCMAERMRSYLDQLERDGETEAGWAVGRSRKTLDGKHVVPRNAATAAMYTYTPWVSSNRDHFDLWRKVASFAEYHPPGPGGCEAATFPSGVTLQLSPSSTLAVEYPNAGDPLCFLDSDGAYDPDSFASYDASVKLADNFRLSEFAERASSRRMLLEPGLVEGLQAVRERLGHALSIRVGYQSPSAMADACASVCSGDSCPSAPSCEPPRELSLGTAALVSSKVTSAAVLDAAAAVGIPSCWAEGEHVYIGTGSALGCPR